MSSDRSQGGLTAAVNALNAGSSSGQSVSVSGVDILEGLQELQLVLMALERKTGKRILTKALRAGATQIVRSIRQSIPPSKDGSSRKEIKRTIGRSVKVNKQDGTVTAKVGVHVGDAKRNEKNWWAHLLAMGTQSRVRQQVGGYYAGAAVRSKSTGRITAEDFVNIGFNKVSTAVQGTIARKARAVLQEEVLLGRA